MRVLLLCHSFNSLAQRLHVELRERGHEVSVELDIHDSVTEEAVALFRPDLVVAPFLKRAIPESVWRRSLSLIVHPGVIGDRGPSALDWAILRAEPEWGVTVLEANAVFDAGISGRTASFLCGKLPREASTGMKSPRLPWPVLSRLLRRLPAERSARSLWIISPLT